MQDKNDIPAPQDEDVLRLMNSIDAHPSLEDDARRVVFKVSRTALDISLEGDFPDVVFALDKDESRKKLHIALKSYS